MHSHLRREGEREERTVEKTINAIASGFQLSEHVFTQQKCVSMSHHEIAGGERKREGKYARRADVHSRGNNVLE